MKLSIYSGLLCAMILISPAWSAKICLKEENNATCTITTEGDSDVIVTCGNTTFRFITFCSATSGTEGQIKNSLSTSSSSTYCWSKMISPKITNWLYHTRATGDSCHNSVPCSFGLIRSINNILSADRYQTLLQILNGQNPLPSNILDASGGGN